MSRQIPVTGSTTEQQATSDSANTPNALVERDSSGNFNGNVITAASTLIGSSGLRLKSTAKSSNFTASKTESSFYVVDTSGGSVTVALPAVASSADMRITVKKTSGSNSLILDGNASETIDGATTKTATAQYATATLWCDGSVWWFESTIGTWS